MGRNLKHLVNTIDDLRQKNIGFKVLTGHGAQIDTTTPSGRLVFGLFAALAEFERELIVERTRAGLAAARGRQGGVHVKWISPPSKWPWLPWPIPNPLRLTLPNGFI